MGDKIQMFNTANDTDQWAVCIDGHFGLFRSRQEAEKVWDSIMGEAGEGPVTDELAETPFGSAQLLSPGHAPKSPSWSGEEPSKISDFEPIDIKQYIENEWKKEGKMGKAKEGANEYEGWEIDMEVFEGNLFGSDIKEIDIHKSSSNYRDMLQDAIEKEYPGAEVSVNLQRGIEGAVPDPSVIPPKMSVDDPETYKAIDDIVLGVQMIGERIWGDLWDSWIAYEEETKEGSVKISERIENINRYLAADDEPETEEQEKEEEPEEERIEEPEEKEEPAEEEAKDFTIEDDEDATEVLEDAQKAAITILDEIVQFCIEQAGNPPAWVKNESIWEEAKAAVEPYKKNYDDFFAVVTYVYKQMGGGIKKK